MKLVFYSGNKDPHIKNFESIIRMCKSIEFEYSIDKDRIILDNYDILICNDIYFPYEKVPERIKIIYGPQTFVFPEGILCSPYKEELKGRCFFNTLCKWNELVFREMSQNFMIDTVQFPFGVDVESFSPSKIEKNIDCLVYIKQRDSILVKSVLSLLKNKNMNVNILTYGSYNENMYKNFLSSSKFMLVIDRHESQGFALQEAMSMNVPLLVLDATSMHDEVDKNNFHIYKDINKNLYATSVPWWSEECGIRIENYEELDETIDIMKTRTFSPRKYILENLTDKVCMERILKLIF